MQNSCERLLLDRTEDVHVIKYKHVIRHCNKTIYVVNKKWRIYTQSIKHVIENIP